MQPVTLVIILLVIVEVGLAVGLVWLRRRNRAVSGPILPRPIPARPPSPLTPPPPAATPETPPTPLPAAAPPPFVLDLTDMPDDDSPEMDEARQVQPTALVLTWDRAGQTPERWHVTVDMVSEDTYAFSGEARRLDIESPPARRVFHTFPFAHDRLLAAEDDQATPIPNIRAWLTALAPAEG